MSDVDWPLDPTPRESAMRGHLRPGSVRQGLPRGRFGLFQRRAKPAIFGEPAFECELVPESVHPARPHVLAWLAWRNLFAAGLAAGLREDRLVIHSAYRPVALQRQIWEYRLNERRAKRSAEGLPPLDQATLERQQRKWTAKPGQSAHHTGLALDLGLYHDRPRAGRTPEYRWLAEHARHFGFYPYLPEPWHWEYNPPGLVEHLAALRRALQRSEPFRHLLQVPLLVPTAPSST